MIVSGVIESVADAPLLDDIQNEVIAEQSSFNSAPPPELIGDLLLLLAAANPVIVEGDTPTHYRYMLSEFLRGSRWQRLRRRLAKRAHHAPLEERRKVALKFLASTMAGQLATYAGPVVTGGADAVREELANAYCDGVDRARDKSENIADDYALLMAEFAQRGFNYYFLTTVLHRQLVELCLAIVWTTDEHEARRLEIVHLPGDEDERLPGDLSGVRAVTIKTREDQLREILPVEFAPWSMGKAGRWATIDKIVNRSPLIFEHFSTTRPMSRHRMLVVLCAAAQRAPQSQAALGAELWARLAVFHLLFAVARKVPRDQVQVDVALFVRDGEAWDGAFFPLEALPARDQAWRNILELDELHPSFFAFHKGRSVAVRRNVELFSEGPGQRIGRELARGIYRGVIVGAFGRALDRRAALPSPSLPLPRLDSETPVVLFGTAEDEQWDPEPEQSEGNLNLWELRARRRAAMYRRADLFRGSVFPDLLSAHMALLPLPRASLSEMAELFLNMVIGPRQKRGVRPGASF